MSDYEVKQHQLFISSLRLLKVLKKQNKISKQHRKMFRKIMLMTILTAPLRWLQSLLFSRKIKKVNFENNPPVFVLGHWRSGTTHLHYLLSKDKKFGYLENFQAFFFRVAFISKTIMKPVLNLFMPKTRPQDNIKINANSPSEEEHPLTNITEKSGMQTFFFPQNISYYDKYNIFKGTTEKEKASWKKSYHWLLQNISYYVGTDKQLLLKNPHSMGRIEVLRAMYPNAKFIHIHRNPYDVYNSNIHLYQKTIRTQFLQEFSDQEIEERVLFCYETSMKKFLKDWNEIPEENRVEISYKELSQNPVETIEKIYEKIQLGDYSAVKPEIENYLKEEGTYKKNKFTPISDEILNKINNRWRFAIDTYKYDFQHPKNN